MASAISSSASVNPRKPFRFRSQRFEYGASKIYPQLILKLL